MNTLRQLLLLPARKPGFVGRLLLFFATVLCFYLASISITHTGLAGCEDDSACHRLLLSKWAYVFGLPVSFAGLAMYWAAIGLATAYERREDRTWGGLLAGAIMASIALAALWFIGLQFFVFNEFCPWCCLTHILAVSGVAMLAVSRLSRPAPDPTRSRADSRLLDSPVFRWISTGAGVTAALATVILGASVGTPGQKIVKASLPSSPSVPPVEDGAITLHGGRFTLRPDEFPLIGKPTAKRFAVALLDYTCGFCREYHAELAAAQQAKGPEFAILTLPASRDEASWTIQYTMLAIFRAKPELFARIEPRLLSGEIPPTITAVQQAAIRALGAEGFTAAISTHARWIKEKLTLTQSIQAANREAAHTGRLPQLVTGADILVGYYPRDSVAQFVTGGSELLARSERGPRINSASAGSGVPIMTFGATQLDLGDLKPGDKVPCDVQLQNTGAGDLKLGWIGLEPGCEVAEMPHNVIRPGDTATIALLVTAPASGAAFRHTVDIHGGPPNGPQTTSTVTIAGRLAPASAIPAPTPAPDPRPRAAKPKPF